MRKTILPWFVLACLALFAEQVGTPSKSLAESGYSIRYVSASPKRDSRLIVGDHIMLSVTVAYKLTVTDTGTIVLVLQKEDNSPVMTGHKQVRTEVSRGAGEITLTDEFDVPPGTRLVRVFVPLRPKGYTHTSGEVVIEYPVKKR